MEACVNPAHLGTRRWDVESCDARRVLATLRHATTGSLVGCEQRDPRCSQRRVVVFASNVAIECIPISKQRTCLVYMLRSVDEQHLDARYHGPLFRKHTSDIRSVWYCFDFCGSISRRTAYLEPTPCPPSAPLLSHSESSSNASSSLSSSFSQIWPSTPAASISRWSHACFVRVVWSRDLRLRCVRARVWR
jgi:hypothetical protein